MSDTPCARRIIGPSEPLSPSYRADFSVKGLRFISVEQFMVFCKAKLFGDDTRAQQTLAASDSPALLAISRSIAGYDKNLWHSKREAYAGRAILSQIEQRPELAERLSNDSLPFAYQNPNDLFWGIQASDATPTDAAPPIGLNAYGRLLDKARAKLLNDRADAERFHPDGSLPSQEAIFVFGSNLAGRHGKGSALAARERYGAIYGQGRGLQGRSYAIPTKDGRPGTPNLRDPRATLSLDAIRASVEEFLVFAAQRPETAFFVVRLGCDLAGHKDSDIGPMFSSAPPNCSFPEPWKPYIAHARPASTAAAPKP
jgi:ribA/ribD-fused uncharacterized protein